MNRHELNILFLASWYPSRVDPFIGNFVQRHARSVSEFANVSVLHACSDPGLKRKYELSIQRNEKVREVIVYYRKVRNKIPIISHLQKFVRNRKALKMGYREIQKAGATDLVHLNVTFPAGLFALYLKKKHNLQYILTEHWTKFLDSDPAAFPAGTGRAILKILRNASVICPVSHDLEKAMQKLAPETKFQVVNNVVDTNLFSVSDHRNERKIILHVSTLNDHHKNISGILRVIRKLSEKRNDFRMLIVGDGDIKPHLTYARELGISEEYLEFRGKQPIEGIARIMQHADMFLLFSNYENLPCVIIEAHASGLPVLSSDVGGISEMINPSNGILVNARDEDELIVGLDEMLDGLDQYDSQKIREEAVGKYSYPVIGNQFLEIYKEIISGRGAQ